MGQMELLLDQNALVSVINEAEAFCSVPHIDDKLRRIPGINVKHLQI